MLIERTFEPNYFNDEIAFERYKQFGFVVFKNVVSTAHLQNLKSIYERLAQMDGYEIRDKFVNSGRFNSTKIRNLVVEEIRKTSNVLLKTIANDVHCDINNGGSFQLKPPSKKSALNPHQDSPIIDERKYYAVFVWIPLCDMNEKNGALSVLPGSHLWGNFQRSLNVPWIYEKHTKLLWKQMQTVEVKEGDIICFDSALIHASGPNRSKNIRVALNTAILPKAHQQVHYYRDKQTPKNKVEQYFIDETFYMNENIMEKPSSKFPLNETQDWQFSDGISRSELKNLLNASKAKLQLR